MKVSDALRNIGRHCEFVPVSCDEQVIACSPSPLRSDGITIGDIRACMRVLPDALQMEADKERLAQVEEVARVLHKDLWIVLDSFAAHCAMFEMDSDDGDLIAQIRADHPPRAALLGSEAAKSKYLADPTKCLHTWAIDNPDIPCIHCGITQAAASSEELASGPICLCPFDCELHSSKDPGTDTGASKGERE